MEFITTDQRIAVENFYIGKIYTITFKNGSYFTRACIGKGADYVMFQEEFPKMLFTLNMQTAANIDSIELGGGGSGTTNYNELDNKPQINSVTLSGNKSSSDLGLQDAISAEDPISASYVSGLATVATTGAYSDLSGLPTLGTAAAAAATDFATAAQGSKADAADTAISTAATGYASLDARLDSMDSTISGKQGALSSAQLDAVNSGIDSTKVAQIETNKTNISWANNYGYKNVINVTRDIIKAANPTLVWTDYTVANHGGLSFTVNPDLSITIYGTTTSASVEFNILRRTDNKAIFKEVGTYRIDGNIQSGKGMLAANRTVSGSGVRYGADEGNTATFDVSQSDLSAAVGIWYGINEGVGVSVDMTIYPMICLSTMDRSYQPYCPSNYELYQMILAL